MTELINTNPEIHRIFVPLPENPLKNLNSYVIKTEERNLIIDTGFNRIECLEALLEGLKELNIDLNKTDIFLTHLHSDHTGLVNKIKTPSSKIYIGKTDHEYIKKNLKGASLSKLDLRLAEEGFPADVLARLKETNQAKRYAPGEFEAVPLEDNQTFNVGDVQMKVISTPGHTPGHVCLYIESEKILFSGDHILFHITPNITAWSGVENSLKDYMHSLDKIKNVPIEKTFPAHRLDIGNPYERIDEIIEHHQYRLNDIITIIETYGENMTAYEIAQYMKWNLRGRPWEEFPDNQKWFAVGETLSHLDYLVISGKVLRTKDEENNLYRYSLRK